MDSVDESFPRHLVSLISLDTGLSVIMSFRDIKVDPSVSVEELRINFSSHEGSVRRTLITVSRQDCRASVCHREEGGLEAKGKHGTDV